MPTEIVENKCPKCGGEVEAQPDPNSFNAYTEWSEAHCMSCGYGNILRDFAEMSGSIPILRARAGGW